jgi:hypothetical protein
MIVPLENHCTFLGIHLEWIPRKVDQGISVEKWTRHVDETRVRYEGD